MISWLFGKASPVKRVMIVKSFGSAGTHFTHHKVRYSQSGLVLEDGYCCDHYLLLPNGKIYGEPGHEWKPLDGFTDQELCALGFLNITITKGNS